MTPPHRFWRTRLATGASAGLLTLALVGFAAQPDALAPLTFWPPWVWVATGLLLTLLGLARGLGVRARRWQLAVAIGWVVFAGLFAEWRPLLRLLLGGAPGVAIGSEGGLRVATLNCAVGDGSGAAGARPHAPDLLLLQESPSREVVAGLARELFGEGGDAVWSADASIVARGQLTRVAGGAHYVAARWRLPERSRWAGRELLVVSVRLRPPRLPFPTGQRAAHRRQLAPVVALLAGHPELPAIVGGDLNMPAHDAALDALRGADLRDAFAEAGVGWGKTVTASLPVSRFDQLWVRRARVTVASAHATPRSDHRLVLAVVQLVQRLE